MNENYSCNMIYSLIHVYYMLLFYHLNPEKGMNSHELHPGMAKLS